MKITRNAARCKSCGDEIESRYTHDFVWCGCGEIAVDGGLSYLRRVGSPDNMEDLSVYDENVEVTQEYTPSAENVANRTMIDVTSKFAESFSDAKDAVEQRGESPIFLGRMLSDTEVVIRLAGMSESEFDRVVRSGKVALINQMFGLKTGSLTRRARSLKRMFAEVEENFKDEESFGS